MLSVIVPCYNEERNLPLLAGRFEKSFHSFKAPYEIILVDNGSTDNSARILEKIVKEYANFRTVRVEKNIGYGHGIMTGLKAARGSVLAFTHADMQCDPMDVVKAYEAYKSSPEKILVKGNRQGRFSLLTSCFHAISGVLFLRHFDDINGQPKLFPRQLLETFKNPPTGFQLDFYVQRKAMQNKYKIVPIPVIFAVRKHGESKWASSFNSRIKNTSRFLAYILKLRVFGE